MKYRFVTHEIVETLRSRNKFIMTYQTEPSWFERFFLRIPSKTVQFRGNCTVWFHHPEGGRCHIVLEDMLASRWEMLHWGDK